MATPQSSDLDFQSASRILNLLDPTLAQHPATKAYVDSAIEGTAWKDSVRVAAGSNISVASPGATVDGVTMASGDRVLLRAQTSGAENGIYVWNGAAVPMTRSLDMNTAAEVEQAITTVEEGTSAGSSWRQTAVNVTLGTTPLAWTLFGASVPAASETTAGIAEIATQAETDAGTDDLRMVTPLKLATYAGRIRKYSTTIGDGSATSYVVTHNLGTKLVQVTAYETGGSFREINVETQHTGTNTVTLIFSAAPASGAVTVVVLG
jgi:hypothetical protein